MKKIIGHQDIARRFENSIRQNRLASTFLFVGPEGVGKKTFALEFAKSLLCETHPNHELNSCGNCEGCQLFDAGNHPDFHFVQKSKNKAFLQIEQFIGDRDHRNRKGLCHDLFLSPFRGGHKIAVIDDTDFFNQESANCLLKLLEEPPDHSILVMIGTSEHKQLDTIRSRSQVIHFQPLSEANVLKILESLDTSTASLSAREIASLSEGSLNVIHQILEEGLLEFRDR
ncbi:MAG: AAA family ATPase, partial [Planctomycetota bacterium]|nr:AAA family ATPase [Planctomycetota bacterium]